MRLYANKSRRQDSVIAISLQSCEMLRSNASSSLRRWSKMMSEGLSWEQGTPLLPAHGRISCGACFKTPGAWGRTSRDEDGWLLENNPLAWGSRDPLTLV